MDSLCLLCSWFPSALFTLALLRCPDIYILCQMRHMVGLTERSTVCLPDPWKSGSRDPYLSMMPYGQRITHLSCNLIVCTKLLWFAVFYWTKTIKWVKQTDLYFLPNQSFGHMDITQSPSYQTESLNCTWAPQTTGAKLQLCFVTCVPSLPQKEC